MWVDEDYDRQTGSSGSRFGNYLRQHAKSFRDPWDDDMRAGSVDFAAAAWRVACSPIMAPGYVRMRPDITAVTVGCDESGEGLRHLAVEVRLPHPALAAREDLYALDDWARDRHFGEQPEYYAGVVKRPTLLATARLLIPFWGEDVPAHPDRAFTGTVDVAHAKASVAALVALVNREAGPAVAALRGAR